MPEKTHRNLCHHIHSSLTVDWSGDGWRVQPCCFTPDVATKIDTSDRDWYSKLWPTLRQDNLADRPLDVSTCGACIKDEIVGKRSPRIGSLDKWGVSPPMGATGPRELEVQIHNTCNNACMICGPVSSSLWKRYADRQAGTTRSRLCTRDDLRDLISNLDLGQLKQIKLLGGEPLLTDGHHHMVELVRDKGVDLSGLTLWYNTNGSRRVDKQTLDLWDRCRQVFVYFSLDDTGVAFNYQRFPGDWQTVTENMRWFRDNTGHNVILRLERTVGLLNAHRLWGLEDWRRREFAENAHGYHTEINTHIAHGLFSLDNISGRHLEFLLADQQNLELLGRIYPVDTLRGNDDGRVLEMVRRQDQLRGVDIRDYFPEFPSLYD